MLTSLWKHSAYRIAVSTLLFLVIVGLPLTTFPPLYRLTGAIVAPFSAIPLAILLLVWLVPFLVEGGKFPAEIVPYLYFILVALIVTALGFFLDGYYARGWDFFDQSLQAFLTVAIGLSFYLVFAAIPRDIPFLRKTLSFINIGGLILILYSIFEIIMLRSRPRFQDLPEWLRMLRNALAIQSPSMVYTTRVTGFAYEPSWFVRQFNLVLFPIWLAAAFQRESVHSFRLWIFSVEDLLLVLGLIVFGAASPRIGLVAFLASLAYLAILILIRLHRYIIERIVKRSRHTPKRLVWTKILLAILMVLILVGLAYSAMFGYVQIASGWDYRYALLVENAFSGLDIFSMTTTDLIYRARDLAFFERVIYWLGGWEVFNDYPFGVGLGNAGFYFYDRMHGAGFESFEIRDVIYRANYLPNTKNLWVRLLAETGFVGLAVFLIWLYVLWRSAGLSQGSHSKELRIVGLAGQFFLLAYLLEGFSMDSFAMPYEWIMVGLISAAGALYRKELRAKEESLSTSEVKA